MIIDRNVCNKIVVSVENRHHCYDSDYLQLKCIKFIVITVYMQ